MEEFKWDPSYSVNNEEADNHHKKIINLFNEVGNLIEEEQEIPLFSTNKVINGINIFAIFHFREEEKLMEEANYPELDQHRVLHEEFIDKVSKLKEDYLNNDPLINYDVVNCLSDWILKHIIVEDAKYKDYI